MNQEVYLKDCEEKIFYWKEGYVVIRDLFNAEEMQTLYSLIAKSSWYKDKERELEKINSRGDWGGGFDTLNVTNKCTGNDAFSLAGRSYKILDRSSFYYEDDAYCYHNKISAKPPGAMGFRPHQDYGGYWKSMGNDFPDPHAVFIAITPCNRENGCLQIVPGSHLLGPLPHTPQGADSGIEEKTWNQILNKGYSPIELELNPGDGIFFHGNSIHLSGKNNSHSPRIGYLVTLNTRRCSPHENENYCGHPRYSRMHRFYGKINESALGTELNPFP